MVKDRRRKQNVRDHTALTGKYTKSAAQFAPAPQLYLPRPPATFRGQRCGLCRGSGVQFGDLHPVRTDAGIEILCEMLCVDCGGCGLENHTGCQPSEHDDPEGRGCDPSEVVAEIADRAEQAGQPLCPLCWGRTWNPVPAYTPGYEPQTYLRMPCECAESLLVPLAGWQPEW